MVALNMKIDPSFFLPEERDGFLVSRAMKEIWAVELDLLHAFACVCEEHHLKWFAHAGTMLGAVRHHGFIPWDDDIDIVMPRQDYEILCRVGPSSFSAPYFFQNEDTDPLFCRNFSRIRNSATTAIQIQDKDFAFPYNQGIFIDIFPYDNLPDDDGLLDSDMREMERLLILSGQYRNLVHCYRPKKGQGMKKRMSHWLKYLWFRYVDRSGRDYLRVLAAHREIATRYNGSDTERVGEMIVPPLGRQIWRREWLDGSVLMPFEMLQIPVPASYEECLTASFGKDWRIPKKQENYHGSVFFDVDRPYTEYFKDGKCLF